MLRDTNINVAINNITESFATTATAAGTTTLTIASNPLQQFTGTNSQIVQLPAANTLSTGFQFEIFNRSTGSLTIKDGSGATIQTMAGGTQCAFTCASISGSAGSWDISYTQDPTKILPSGTLIFVAQNSAPSGYLKANGAAVSRSTYSSLFSSIGTTFGIGDGSTTFNLPDLRGQFVRSWVDDGTIDSGRTFGSTQTDAMQGHYHQLYNAGYNMNGGGGGGQSNSNASLNTNAATGNDIRQAITDGTHGTPRIASETRPTNLALLACIKY